MRRATCVTTCATAVLLLLGLLGLPRPVAAQGDLSIGATVPITSPYALSGRSYYNTLQMAEKDINAQGGIKGRKVKIVFEDTSNSNTTAVNAFKKVIDTVRSPFVFLNSYTVQNLAVEPEVARAKVPVMYAGGGVAVAERGNAWMFRIRPNDEVAAKGAAQFVAKSLKLKRVGLMGVEGDFGQGGMKVAAEVLKQLGVEAVGQEVYRAADKDMSAQLLSLKNKGAEAIVVFTYVAEPPIIFRQRRQLNLGIPLIGSSGSCLPAATNVMTAQDMEGTYCVTDSLLVGNPDPKVHAWAERYQKEFNFPPDVYGVAYYDGMFILKQAIEKAGLEPQALRDAIAATKDYKGIGATFSFDQRGEGVHQVVVVKPKPGTKNYELLETVRSAQ
ncbi:MAG: ABC transporter substrate-binding protein [Candidatus Rokubacteria bacterium]|nr:ABC transporter substrate-binding protein [Candidatus Rokubacteria bacterium]